MKKLNFDKIVWICAGVFLAIVLSITFLSNDVHKGAGIDIYLAPEKSIFGGMITRDYMRIQSDKQTYSSNEEIVLNASCGFTLILRVANIWMYPSVLAHWKNTRKTAKNLCISEIPRTMGKIFITWKQKMLTSPS